MKNVQAFIVSVSVPQTLEQLFYHVNEYDWGGYFIDELLNEWDGTSSWTVPRWAKCEDIVFFFHVRSAAIHLRRLAKELKAAREEYSQEEYDDVMSFIQRGLDIHAKYGGKIFAAARVTGAPEYLGHDEEFYWNSPIYAEIGGGFLLDHPVDISEFREFLRIQQGTITPVLGGNFDQLRELIRSKGNSLPDYVLEATAAPIPLSAINSENWLSLCYEWRNRFFLEEQFRKFYADYLLRGLSDDGKLYCECRVKKDLTNYRVDNVILFNGKYLPVEIKLNIENEAALTDQLEQYCCGEIFLTQKSKNALNPERVHANRVLVIDTEGVYLYDAEGLVCVCELYGIHNLEDLAELRDTLAFIVCSS